MTIFKHSSSSKGLTKQVQGKNGRNFSLKLLYKRNLYHQLGSERIHLQGLIC